MPVVSGEGDGGEFSVADFDAFGVFGGVVVGLDGEPGFGGGGGDELDDGAYGGEGPASPVESDEAEHAVFDSTSGQAGSRIPLSPISRVESVWPEDCLRPPGQTDNDDHHRFGGTVLLVTGLGLVVLATLRTTKQKYVA